MTKKGYSSQPLSACIWQATVPENAERISYDAELLKKTKDSIHAKFPGCFRFHENETAFSKIRFENQFLLLLEIKASKPMSPGFWEQVIEHARTQLKDKKPVIFLRTTAIEEVTQ